MLKLLSRKMNLISVDCVLLNYNSGSLTVNLAEHLAKSPSVNSVIIVDNKSSNNSLKELNKVKNSKIVIIQNKDNLGFAAGINVGIRRALKKQTGQILIVNPDININNSDLSKLYLSQAQIISPVLKFKKKDTWLYDLGGKVNWILGRTYHKETSVMPSVSSHNNSIDFVSGACMKVSKNVFRKIGLFDERYFMYFEDVDFCLRAKREEFNIDVNLNVIVQHNLEIHKISKNLSKIKNSLISNYKFIKKWLPAILKPTAYLYIFFLVMKYLYLLLTTSYSTHSYFPERA